MSSSVRSKPVKVNMRMIAKKAGVSATTVSLALRNDPSISQATKTVIRGIQRELGYRPREGRTKTHGDQSGELTQLTYHMVGFDLREDNYTAFLHGVSEECRQRSIKLDFECELDTDRAVETLRATAGAAKVLILTGTLGEDHIAAARASGVPFVVLGNYSFAEPVHMVAIDLMGAACDILSSLKNQAMRSLAIVVEQSHTAFERSCLRCFRGAFLDLDYSPDQLMVLEAGTGFSKVHEVAKAILKQKQPGLKVLSVEPHCAQHLVVELQSINPSALKNLPIFTLGDPPTGKMVHRRFSTFNVGKEECARLAVARACELYRSPGITPCTVLIRSPGWT